MRGELQIAVSLTASALLSTLPLCPPSPVQCQCSIFPMEGVVDGLSVGALVYYMFVGGVGGMCSSRSIQWSAFIHLSFQLPGSWMKMIFSEMSVKGERGESGGGVRKEGEKREHVNVRGRLMRTQRVEFSIRQLPPSSLSLPLCSRSGSEGVIPALLLLPSL